MKSKSSNFVLEMIDQFDTDEETRRAMKDVFRRELIHSNSPSSKTKTNNYREIIEKATK